MAKEDTVSLSSVFPLVSVLTQEEKEEIKASVDPLVATQDAAHTTSSETQQNIEFGQLFPVIQVPSPLLSTPERVLPIAAEKTLGISTYFSRFHWGIDIRAPLGTPVVAVHRGTVIDAAFEKGGYGRYVIIENTSDEGVAQSLYAHLKSTTVKPGDVVRPGTIIGYVGLTGRTTGSHLHFEIHQAGRAIDPIRYLQKGLTVTLAKK